MNKGLLISLSGIILGISSSIAMAEPCAPGTECRHDDHHQNPKVEQHSAQPQKAQPQQAAPKAKTPQATKAQPQKAAQASAKGYRTVKVQSARLRSGPGTHYPVVKGLKKGDKVTIIKEQGNWAQVQIGTSVFWIAASLLSAN